MGIQKILVEFKTEAKKLDGRRLKDIILYGSWARGGATQDSDIDLLVVLKGEVASGTEFDRMLDIITDINLKYNVLISVYPVSEGSYSTINSPLFLNVHKEGITV